MHNLYSIEMLARQEQAERLRAAETHRMVREALDARDRTTAQDTGRPRLRALLTALQTRLQHRRIPIRP